MALDKGISLFKIRVKATYQSPHLDPTKARKSCALGMTFFVALGNKNQGDKHKENKHLCQQLSIIEAHCGSTSVGISNRWFMNPTAPITCKYPKEVAHMCSTFLLFRISI